MHVGGGRMGRGQSSGGIGRILQGSQGKTTGRIAKDCKRVGLGSCEISVRTSFND